MTGTEYSPGGHSAAGGMETFEALYDGDILDNSRRRRRPKAHHHCEGAAALYRRRRLLEIHFAQAQELLSNPGGAAVPFAPNGGDDALSGRRAYQSRQAAASVPPLQTATRGNRSLPPPWLPERPRRGGVTSG